MYRIVTLTGRTRDSGYVRYGLAAAYMLFATAGGMFLASKDALVGYGAAGVHMSAAMLAGGLLCAAGSFTRHWVGEFVGAPLLVAALSVLGVETLAINWSAHPHLAAGNTTLLWGIAAVLTARWRVVLATMRLAHAVALRQGSP